MLCTIGITCNWLEKEQRNALHNDYVEAVVKAGGLPLLLPSLSPRLAGAIYESCDGFIFSGGHDLDPVFFMEEPRVGLGEITPYRDDFELALAGLALNGEKPVLAICRGIQVLNVAAGGTLHQDIKNISTQLHDVQSPRHHPVHQVNIEPGSRLACILQDTSIRVNSFHHQAVDEPGPGLKAVAWSRDGLIEALEAECGELPVLGVQWHPECSCERDVYSVRLFRNLVLECEKRRGS